MINRPKKLYFIGRRMKRRGKKGRSNWCKRYKCTEMRKKDSLIRFKTFKS